MTYSETPIYFEAYSFLFEKERKCKSCYYTPNKGYLTRRPPDTIVTKTVYSEPDTYWEYSMNKANGVYKIISRSDWIIVA